MSALVNASGEYLGATLGTGPLETEWKLVAVWIKDVGETLGSSNYIFDLLDSVGNVNITGRTSSALTYTGSGQNGGGGTPTASAGAVTLNVWALVGTLIGPNTGSGTAVVKAFREGTTTSTTTVNSATSARALVDLWVGRRKSDGTARWRGRMAEIAVFVPTSEAQGDTIMSELATYTADTIPSLAPVWYRPLFSDANTGGTGTGDFTVNGTTTFESGDHPSLTDYASGNPRLLGNYYRN